jgi:hypothetical protein
VDVQTASFNRKNGLLDASFILEACTCLITALPEDDDYQIQLAHYTVKEYLTSERIGGSVAASFRISSDMACYFAARCFITYMLERDYSEFLASTTAESATSLMFSATTRLGSSFGGITSAESKTATARLMLKLFNPTRPHFQNWVKISVENSGDTASPIVRE